MRDDFVGLKWLPDSCVDTTRQVVTTGRTAVDILYENTVMQPLLK